MSSVKNPKLHTITYSSGRIKNLGADYEVLNIRGSVFINQEVKLKEISSHGFSSFSSHVEANLLKNSGFCTINGNCQVNEIINAGTLKILHAKINNLTSSGKLTIEKSLSADNLHIKGIIRAFTIQTKHLHLKLSGVSKIDRLNTEELNVDICRKSISLFKKKLICQYIKGIKLNVSNTEAEIIEGNIVMIGKNCKVHTLYYKEDYSIAPNAIVQHVIKRK